MTFTDLFALAVSLQVYVIAAIVAAIAWRLWPFYREQTSPNVGAGVQVRETTLDAMRGLLCIGVLVSHGAITLRLGTHHGDWLAIAGAESKAYLVQGELAVDLFFATTAFLFYGRAVATAGQMSLRRFFVQRVARIAPVYILSAVAVATLAISRDADTWRQPSALMQMAVTMPWLGAVAWPILGPNSLVPYNAGVEWTLLHEWAFYLCFPALLYLCRGAPVAARLLVCFAVASWVSGGVGNVGPPTMFVTGIAAVHLRDDERIRRFARSVGGSFSCVALVGIELLFSPSGYSPAGLLVASIVFVLIVSGTDAFGLLRLRSLQTLGVASYSIYLLHGMILYLARPLILRQATPDAPGFAEWWPVCGIAAVSVGISLQSFRWIEFPGMQLGRWIATRGRVGPSGLSSLLPPRPLPIHESASAP